MIILLLVLFILTSPVSSLPACASRQSVVNEELSNWERKTGSYEKVKAPALGNVKDQYVRETESRFIGTPETTPAPLRRKETEWEAGLEYYTYKYEETVGGAHFMDLQGNFFGAYGAFAYTPPDPGELGEFITFYKVEGRFASANLDYDGGATVFEQDGDSYDIFFSHPGHKDFVWEIRGLIGKDFVVSDYRLSPYSGFGYRHLRDDGNDVEVNGLTIHAYDRISHYSYIPIGIDVYRAFPAWSANFNLEYDYLVYGKQRSNSGGAFVAPDTGDIYYYDALRNYQYEGFGLRASLKLQKTINGLSFAFEPYVRYWDIEDSDWARFDAEQSGNTDSDYVGIGYEPSNETTEAGVKLGLTF